MTNKKSQSREPKDTRMKKVRVSPKVLYSRPKTCSRPTSCFIPTVAIALATISYLCRFSVSSQPLVLAQEEAQPQQQSWSSFKKITSKNKNKKKEHTKNDNKKHYSQQDSVVTSNDDTVPLSTNTTCLNNQTEGELNIYTDSYDENSFGVYAMADNGTWAEIRYFSGFPYGWTIYNFIECFDDEEVQHCVRFTMYDSYGDGVLTGGYELWWDGVKLKNYSFYDGYLDSVMFGPDCPSSAPTFITPSPSSAPSSAPTVLCVDSPLEIFLNKNKKRTCTNIDNKVTEQCNKRKVKSHCPNTCDECDKFASSDSLGEFFFENTKRKCSWLRTLFVQNKREELESLCENEEVANTCRESCFLFKFAEQKCIKGKPDKYVLAYEGTRKVEKLPDGKMCCQSTTDFTKVEISDVGSCPCNVQDFIGGNFEADEGAFTYTIENFGQEGSQWKQWLKSGDFLHSVGQFDRFKSAVKVVYKGGDECGSFARRKGLFIIKRTSNPNKHGTLQVSEPSTCVYKMDLFCYQVNSKFFA